MRIRTNDPGKPWLSVVVTGKVERFVEIDPTNVLLTGKEGESLSAEVTIVPRKAYPFKILRLEASDGTFIKYELKESCAEGKDRCVIQVENAKADKGRYADRIIIHTDSALRPTIPIRVMGRIH